MFKRIITRGNDSTLVYDTKINLQTMYMVCPWAPTVYHICDEHLQELFSVTEKVVKSYAMRCGCEFLLFDSRKIDGVHHYYFREIGGDICELNNTGADSNIQSPIICNG